MKKKYKLIILIVLSFVIYPLMGQKYILLVDVSGSLVAHDPLDLRKPSLRYFVDQLNPDDSLAVYSFGEGVYTHNRNGELFLPVGQNKNWIVGEINKLPRGDQLTDLRAALQQILIDLLDYDSDEPINLFLFTDAQLKPGDIPRGIDIEAYIKQVFDLGDKLARQNVRIFGLAFTHIADLDYLEMLASKTLGNALLADTPESANKAIMELLHQIRYGPHPSFFNIPIRIDESHASFTVHAFNRKHGQELPHIQLTNPEGEVDESLVMENYETTVTATKESPQAGRWTAYIKGAKDVEVYFTKKVTYDLIFHSPKYRDLNIVQGSQLYFDIEIIDINKDLLEKFDASVSILTHDRKLKHKSNLERTDNRLKGSKNIDIAPGVYRIILDLQAPEEKITREYILTVEEGVDIDYSLDKDLVINNPVWVSVAMPEKVDSADFKIIVNTPDNLIKEFILFDDGIEKHGDALAGDGIYSNRIYAFNKPGVYSIEIILLYEHNGMPVTNRKVEKVFKTISLDKETVGVRFPRDSEWTVYRDLKIENKSSHKVFIDSIIVEKEWQEKLNIIIVNDERTISPREDYILKLEYTGKNIPLENSIINSKIKCVVFDERTNQKVSENEIINLQHELSVKHSLLFWLIIIFSLLIIIIIALIIIGLSIITPRRFHEMVYRGNDGSEVYLNGLRKSMKPYVDVDDSCRIGLTLFGYGYWYATLSDQGTTKTIKHAENIDGLKKTTEY